GPAGLALIIGSSNMVNPKVTLDAITPAFVYLAAWFAVAGVVYLGFGFETKGRSFEAIDVKLAAEPPRVALHPPQERRGALAPAIATALSLGRPVTGAVNRKIDVVVCGV